LPRAYHIDLAQYVAAADARWVDNLISRFSLPGIDGSGRGESRRITEVGIQHIALIRSLTVDLGLALTVAVPLAKTLLSSPDEDALPAGPWIRVAFRRAEFARHVDARIADGVESITPTRRGRPPTSRHRSA
jgi:hypothetical protein